MTEWQKQKEQKNVDRRKRREYISPLCSLLIFIVFLMSPFDELESVAIENTLFCVPETIMCFDRVEK